MFHARCAVVEPAADGRPRAGVDRHLSSCLVAKPSGAAAWLWLLLLAKLVTPPLVHVPLLPSVVNRTAVPITTPPAIAAQKSEIAIEPPAQTAGDDAADVVILAPAIPAARRASKPLAAASADAHRDHSAMILPGLLMVSLLGSCVLLLFHATAAAKLYRWLRRAAADEPRLAAACAEVAAKLHVGPPARSCVVERENFAATVGLVSPDSRCAATTAGGTGAAAVARSCRPRTGAPGGAIIGSTCSCSTVKALLWWNPVVWWADRELRAAQELCCDAIAIDRGGADRRSYADTLLRALDFIQAEPAVPRALATAMGSRGTILRRFEMIGNARLSYQLSRWSLLMLLAAAAPLMCIPVRGQEQKRCARKPELPAAVSTARANGASSGDKAPGTASGSAVVLLSNGAPGQDEPQSDAKARGKPADQTKDNPQASKPAKAKITKEGLGFMTMRSGPGDDPEMDKLIKDKKFEFVKTFESRSGEKQYVYRFTYPDGRRVNRNFSVPLDGVSSWADYQKKEQLQREQRNERISQALTSGRFRLLNLEVMQIHICRDAASGTEFKVQRIQRADGSEIAFPRADYGPIPAAVKETSWQEHLQAIRDGKRELLKLETTNSYTYEMTADDGTKEVFQYGGNEPLDAMVKRSGHGGFESGDCRQDSRESRRLFLSDDQIGRNGIRSASPGELLDQRQSRLRGDRQAGRGSAHVSALQRDPRLDLRQHR